MPADTPTTETQFARARQIKAAHPLDIIAMTSDTAGRMSKLTVPELRLWLDAATTALRRERAKATTRHWSYDLNRHIALKTARDRLRAGIERRRGQRKPETQKAA
jgi:hypothetical protein